MEKNMRAAIMETDIEKNTGMKWKLGFYRGI